MYDRYMPPAGSFRPLPPEEAHQAEPSNRPPQERRPSGRQKPPDSGLLGELAGGVTSFLGDLFQGFSLKDLDSGDILLVLIILFLFLEGDNLDLVIVLGLMLLLGFGKQEEKQA